MPIPTTEEILAGNVPTLEDSSEIVIREIITNTCEYLYTGDKNETIDEDTLSKYVDNYIIFMLDNFTREDTLIGLRILFREYRVMPRIISGTRGYARLNEMYGDYILNNLDEIQYEYTRPSTVESDE